MPLTHLSLFSGIGGIDLAAERDGFAPVRTPYTQQEGLVNKMTLFEIIRSGKVVMHTSNADCIYHADILKQMLSAGYTFRLNGKAWQPSEMLNETDSGQLML